MGYVSGIYMKANCPNCGAVIDPWKQKCDYCGTAFASDKIFLSITEELTKVSNMSKDNLTKVLLFMAYRRAGERR